MRTDVVTYFNGKRFMRRTRRSVAWPPTRHRVHITFAYRGVPQEWPTVIHYAIR